MAAPETNPPLRDCASCGGPAKMVTTLPPVRGTPSLAIFRCSLCGAVDWMTPQQLPIRSAQARVKDSKEFAPLRFEPSARLKFALDA